jgi:SAM-dependent methyltransferase
MMIKKVLKSLFPGLIAYRNRFHNQLKHVHFRNRPIKEVFHAIYTQNHWAGQESVSGPGSSTVKTFSIRESIPQLILKYGISSVLDIPCGDFNWMNQVDLQDLNYIGMDIVNELVNKNTAAYAKSNRSFSFADITGSDLPKSDLIICRDCMVHLSYDDINRAVANIKRSQSAYLLATTFPNHSNHNIITGNWRPVNLSKKPFYWPSPLELLSEDEEGDNSDKSLALWRISDLKQTEGSTRV